MPTRFSDPVLQKHDAITAALDACIASQELADDEATAAMCASIGRRLGEAAIGPFHLKDGLAIYQLMIELYANRALGAKP